MGSFQETYNDPKKGGEYRKAELAELIITKKRFFHSCLC